jgi:hypothetical protein
VTDRTKNSIHKYGGNVCLNGWDNVNSCPLLNIMLDCSSENLFLKTINTTRDWKDEWLEIYFGILKSENCLKYIFLIMMVPSRITIFNFGN